MAWVPSDASGVEGYRILRSEVLGGPYVLVGQSAGETYVDYLLETGVTYLYVVQAYDAYGAFCPYSNEGSAALSAEKLFLPIIQR